MYPSSPVQSITWYFNPGSEASLVNTSDPDVRTLTQTGTSVLVLENVGPERDGSYHCQVTLDAGGNPLISGEGFLVVNGEFATHAIPLYCSKICVKFSLFLCVCE